MNRSRSLSRWPFDGQRGELSRLVPEQFLRLMSDFDEEGMGEGWKPAVDVKETDKQYIITADIPGVDPKDIEVTMDNGVLTIQGDRQTEDREERKGYRRVERFEGTFYRRLSLPDAGDSENVEARSRNGVLEITIAKQPQRTARRIQVKD